MELVAESADDCPNATLGSGMPQYEGRYQEYGQPQQNYALRYTSYETSVPPSRYQPPQQQMPQIAQYEQPPSRSSESTEGWRNGMCYSDRGQMPVKSAGKAGSIPASDSSIIGPFVRFRTENTVGAFILQGMLFYTLCRSIP